MMEICCHLKGCTHVGSENIVTVTSDQRNMIKAYVSWFVKFGPHKIATVVGSIALIYNYCHGHFYNVTEGYCITEFLVQLEY